MWLAFMPSGVDTAIVLVGRMCGSKDPVCETFYTNKGPKSFISALIRVQSFWVLH